MTQEQLEACLISLACPIIPSSAPLFVAIEITPNYYNFYKLHEADLYLRHDVGGAVQMAQGKETALARLRVLYDIPPTPSTVVPNPIPSTPPSLL